MQKVAKNWLDTSKCKPRFLAIIPSMISPKLLGKNIHANQGQIHSTGDLNQHYQYHNIIVLSRL